MSTAFHRESQKSRRMRTKRKKMQQRQTSISSIISRVCKARIPVSAAGLMCDKTIEANACRMIGYVHFTPQLSDVIHDPCK